ncbi:MAG TPA: extracellular solute-binding protein [Chthoniobacterales bacterium]
MIKRLALLVSLTLPLAGCGKKSPTAPEAAGSAIKDVPVQIEDGGEPDPVAVPTALKGGTFTTWAGGYPKSLNMWLDYNSFSKSVCDLLFEPLVALHPTRDEPVGILAKSWEISSDKKTFTFHLDPQAKWSDGQPVTAEDVQFYYDTMMNPKNLTSIFRVDLSRFSRPEVVDPLTVRITANQPHWANFWTAAGMVAFPKHVWKDLDFNRQNFELPVVSGPYQLGEIKTNRSIQLKRRGDWWGRVKQFNVGKYNFDYLLFKAMEDRNKAFELFKSGGLDLLPMYTASIWVQKTPDIPQVKKNWIVRQTVANQEPKAFQGMAMNMQRPLFQDPKVRQALALLFNRELMNEKLMFDQYFLLNSYYPDLYPNNQNPAVPLVKYNEEAARALLKEAGWTVGADGILQKDGKPFSFTIVHYDGSELRHLNIYLQSLKSVGIDAKIEVISMSSFQKRVDNHDFDMCWTNWGASRLRDPEASWASKTADEIATNNVTALKDPEIDRLIEQQKTEMDMSKRNDILRQIDARLVAISPFVLMWQNAKNRLLYWNKFGTPKYVLDKFSKEEAALVYWWLDPAKEKALTEAMKADAALPPVPAEVTYAGE